MSGSTEQLAAAAESEPLSPVEIPTLKSLFVELRFGETVLGNATACDRYLPHNSEGEISRRA
jgi:hypothetical protein